ncbi:hypothetical protein SAMN04488072_104153 [Lentibacillus halodurans]|uniref:Uncharacterized protein n=1 Tax=Lentibacillus halodurans TaxID=237679 RepID=A0A1I0X6A0_9BACI|nr:hypothetical protein SAMN04488072_104153 [Lentibacillus halodurans]
MELQLENGHFTGRTEASPKAEKRLQTKKPRCPHVVLKYRNVLYLLSTFFIALIRPV